MSDGESRVGIDPSLAHKNKKLIYAPLAQWVKVNGFALTSRAQEERIWGDNKKSIELRG